MLLQFFQDVLPSTGHYCLFLSGTKRHVWSDSLDGLVHATNERIDAQGVYFATASFNQATTRTADNVALRRALAFDIDAGPDKYAKHGDSVYPTQRDAALAVVEWAKGASLMPSYLVSSGAGLHVYYCLDADTAPAQWLPVAKGLKAMALAQGLRIDPTVTSDAARVLRPPGTLHSSGARVKILSRGGYQYSMENMAARVAAFVPSEAPKRERRLNAEVLEAPVGPPKSAEKIRQQCPAMAHAMNLRGDVAEPYWRAMLGVIKFTVEGADAAHAYSQGHPAYDHDVTQTKFDRWTAGPTTCAVFEGENPAACAGCAYRGTIKSPVQLGMLNIAELAAQPAPLIPIVEEPLPFGDDDDVPAATVAPWEGYLPDGFFVVRAPDMSYALATDVRTQVKTPTGEETFITARESFCNTPIWLESWAPGTSDTDQAMAVFALYSQTLKRTARYNLPTRTLAKTADFLVTLASQNILVYPPGKRSTNSMENYIRASMERIRASRMRPKIMDRFGTFYNHHNELTVAQGMHLITKSGEIYEGVPQDKLRTRGNAYTVPLPSNLSGHWGPEVWSDYILPRAKRHVEYLDEFYADPNFRPYQLAISLAIASPLLTFVQGNYYPGSDLPGMGLTVSLYSPKSGIGKTSAMAAAAMAYGVPSNIVAQLDRNNSTGNARGEMALQAGTMPSFMDEMEDVAPGELASLLSSVGNGVTKKRMNKDLSITGGDKMTLVNIMSTNKSHREIAAADRTGSMAVQMRLMEIECSSVLPVSQDRSLQETEARSALADCAGALGAVIHLHMCKMGADQLNKVGIECADRARRMLSASQDGRFMWRAFGAVLMMRRILKIYDLKFFPDLDALTVEFKKWHDASYAFALEGSMPTEPDQILALFLSDISGSTLVTHTMKGAGRAQANATMDLVLNDRTPDKVVARSVLSERCVYVKADALRDWCLHRKLGHTTVINGCRDLGVLESVDYDKPNKITHSLDLFRGTKLAQGVPVAVFKVNVTRLGRDIDYSDVVGDNVHRLHPQEPADMDQIPKSSASS